MALPAEVLAALPEDIRGSEHIASFNDVGSLVKGFIETKTADWKSGLPDDLKTEKSLEGFKAVGDLAKGFVETKKLVGQSLRAPAADAADEEWEKYYKAGGKPNAPEEYKFALPEDFKLTPAEEKEVRDTAYRMGLNNRQTQKLIDIQAAGIAEARKAEREELMATEKAFREKWGGNFERNKAIMTRAIERIDPDKKLRAFFDSTGLGNHPVMIDLMHEWGKRLVEDGLMPGDVAGVTGREEAKAKIEQIQKDPKHPYHTSKTGDPAFDEMQKLHQIAYD
jgi:hypothetical protein